MSDQQLQNVSANAEFRFSALTKSDKLQLLLTRQGENASSASIARHRHRFAVALSVLRVNVLDSVESCAGRTVVCVDTVR